MANPEVAYEHSGTAAPTTLAAPMTDTDLTFTVIDGTGYPTGAGGNFFMSIDKANQAYERILCSGRVGNVFTVAASGGRGADGTVARDHSIQAPAEHTWSAVEATQLSQHISKTKDIHGVTSDVVGVDDIQTMTNKTLTLPTIGSFTNAGHDHSNAAGGGAVPQASITGLVAALAALQADIDANETAANAAIALRQLLSEKGAANGYAGLDASGLVAFADLPTGDGAAEVAVGDHGHVSLASLDASLTERVLADGEPVRTLATTDTLSAGKYLIFGVCAGVTLATAAAARWQYDLSNGGGSGTLRTNASARYQDSTALAGGGVVVGYLDLPSGTTTIDFTVLKNGNGALITTSTNGMLIAVKIG